MTFITGRGITSKYEDRYPAYVPLGIILCSPSKYNGKDIILVYTGNRIAFSDVGQVISYSGYFRSYHCDSHLHP